MTQKTKGTAAVSVLFAAILFFHVVTAHAQLAQQADWNTITLDGVLRVPIAEGSYIVVLAKSDTRNPLRWRGIDTRGISFPGLAAVPARQWNPDHPRDSWTRVIIEKRLEVHYLNLEVEKGRVVLVGKEWVVTTPKLLLLLEGTVTRVLKEGMEPETDIDIVIPHPPFQKIRVVEIETVNFRPVASLAISPRGNIVAVWGKIKSLR